MTSVSANKSSSGTSSVLMRFSSSLGFPLGARFAIFLNRYASAPAPDTQSNASDVDRSCSVDGWGTSSADREAKPCRAANRESIVAVIDKPVRFVDESAEQARARRVREALAAAAG
jgi:hypothetical protein